MDCVYFYGDVSAFISRLSPSQNCSVMKPYKSVYQNIALLIGSAIFFMLILFVIGELYLGAKYAKEHERLISKMARMESGLCFTHSSNPTLIYTFIPNNTNNNCHINSNGYRDYEYNQQKDAKTFRVIIIGDSVAQGYGVPLEETFGKVLERRLNDPQDHAPYKVEVIVLARSGYSTNQELILLENEAFGYSPDLIVWSYTLNDPADPLFHNANGELGTYFYKPTFHTLHWIKRQIFVANEKSKRKDCEKEYHEMLHCVYWKQVALHVARIGEVAKKKGIPVIFLIHPVFQKERHFKEYSLTSLHLKLGDLATNAGLIVVDALDVYKNYHSDELRQQVEGGYDPWHPNAKGHMITADYLYEKIKQGRYIENKSEK